MQWIRKKHRLDEEVQLLLKQVVGMGSFAILWRHTRVARIIGLCFFMFCFIFVLLMMTWHGFMECGIKSKLVIAFYTVEGGKLNRINHNIKAW